MELDGTEKRIQALFSELALEDRTRPHEDLQHGKDRQHVGDEDRQKPLLASIEAEGDHSRHGHGDRHSVEDDFRRLGEALLDGVEELLRLRAGLLDLVGGVGRGNRARTGAEPPRATISAPARPAAERPGC